MRGVRGGVPGAEGGEVLPEAEDMSAEGVEEEEVNWREAEFCHWCGRRLNDKPRSGTRRTRDHLIPRSRGGKGLLNNVVTACAECNLKRGNSMTWRPYQWRRRKERSSYEAAQA